MQFNEPNQNTTYYSMEEESSILSVARTSPLSFRESLEFSNEPVAKKKYSHSWTQKDDELLENAVHVHGACHWRLIAELVPGRTRKQCRERYCNHLDPKINKSTWSAEEDALLFKLHREFGNKWSYIKKYLPGRTANSIKNRYTSRIKKNDLTLSVFAPVNPVLYTVY